MRLSSSAELVPEKSISSGCCLLCKLVSCLRPDALAGVKIIEGIDCSKSDCGEKIVQGLKGTAIEVVIYVAGILIAEVRDGLLYCFEIRDPTVILDAVC